ncbi:hypothetical protein TNCV_1568781 [Trichonephila clavipes]|nr:hypothetical protein TNCV_1568781 [Trichonephila clavipes]
MAIQFREANLTPSLHLQPTLVKRFHIHMTVARFRVMRVAILWKNKPHCVERPRFCYRTPTRAASRFSSLYGT